MSAKIGVITFPGTLDDVDAARAARLAGAEVVSLWHADADLKNVDVVVVPGGFSYGDYLRSGAISALAPVMQSVIDAAGRVHRTRTLEADQVRAVVRAVGDVAQAPVSVFASTLERDYVLDDPIGLSTDQRTPPDRFTAAPLSQVAGLGVTSMPLHIPDVRAAAALAGGLEETVDGISCTRSTGFVDVTAAGESKGTGLGRLAELLASQGVEVSEVAAVGDSWNDISMFEQADIPCAMAGAPGEVVEAAGGRTTPSVAAFIEALLA